MKFEDAVTEAVQSSIIKELSKGDWFTFRWGDRVQVALDDLKRIYDKVDMDRVADIVKEKVEYRIADAIFNSIATEVATDVKRVLSNTELREQCRGIIRNKINEMCGEETKKKS